MEKSKINLCDYCLQKIPVCTFAKIEYGNGRGNDNITNCDGFAYSENGGSNIQETGYNFERNNVLIKFINGNIYTYKDVPIEVYEELKKAPSMGSYIHQNFKGVYNYTRIL